MRPLQAGSYLLEPGRKVNRQGTEDDNEPSSAEDDLEARQEPHGS